MLWSEETVTVTRDEAQLRYEIFECDSVIDKIYDDFESRTCENCYYWDKRLRMCDNKNSFAFRYLATVTKTDGCNEFERGDNARTNPKD